MSLQDIYATKAINVTELKRSNTDYINNINEPIAILKRDSIKAYLIPVELMKIIMKKSNQVK